ncbi:MAG TPA: alpha/beta fold hydrolase [Rhodanobacteraceae bacterium]|nr:alpha/beta fold hydrolase [Rhodanobacteraceae bacterium]
MNMQLMMWSAVWFMASAFLGFGTARAATPDMQCKIHAQAALEAFTHGQYKQTVEHFAPGIAGAVTPDKLESVWGALETRFGDFRKLGELTPRTVKGQAALVAPLTFAKGELDAVTACNDKDQLTSFGFVPPSMLASLEGKSKQGGASAMAQLLALTKKHENKPHQQVKARVEPDGVRIMPLSVPSPLGPLPGALILPAGKGPFPAVVLVQGSGQSDMDETIGPNKPFRDIAEGLARTGVASLRYDKRGFVYPEKMADNKHFTMDDEVTDDALAALQLLAKQKSVDPRRVFVLGHSEGALLVPRMLKRDPQAAGGIMLAAPARSLLTVLEEQAREQGTRLGLSKTQIAANLKAIAAERALLDKADPQHPPQGTFGHAPQTWWLSLHDYHQMAVAKSLSRPMLILQGGSDFQVSPEKDFDQWKKALDGRENVAFHLFPGLSHLFMEAGKTGTVADYIKPGKVSPQVIDVIADWIKAQP